MIFVFISFHINESFRKTKNTKHYYCFIAEEDRSLQCIQSPESTNGDP